MATIRTSRADVNYLSISANIGEWYSGSPTPLPAIEPYPSELTPLHPLDFDATLKICDDTKKITLTGMAIAQGRENAVDFNNGVIDCAVVGYLGTPTLKGDQVITVKGGCKLIHVGGTVCSAKPRNAIVVVGAWSDQSFDPSAELDFTGLSMDDGSPVTFIFGRVNHPLRAALGRPRDIYLPEGAKVLLWKSLGYQIAWWAKRAYTWAIWAWHVG